MMVSRDSKKGLSVGIYLARMTRSLGWHVPAPSHSHGAGSIDNACFPTPVRIGFV